MRGCESRICRSWFGWYLCTTFQRSEQQDSVRFEARHREFEKMTLDEVQVYGGVRMVEDRRRIEGKPPKVRFFTQEEKREWERQYASQLKANGEDVKVVQESLRHANSRITLDTYTQASTPAKRRAQTKVVGMIFCKTDSNRKRRRRELMPLNVPFCSRAQRPRFPQVLEKNGGDDGTRNSLRH
jgi:hypothetical protein